MADDPRDAQGASGTSSPAPAPPDDRSAAEPKITRPTRRTIIVMSMVLIAGILFILWAWRLWPFNSAVETTDNAYARGQVTILAPQVNGYVTRVMFTDFQHVTAGQELFRIDDRLYRQDVATAEAAVAQARANLHRAGQTIAQDEAVIEQSRAELLALQAERDRSRSDAARVAELAGRGAVSLRERDTTTATARTGSANLEKGRAAIRIGQEALKASIIAREGMEAAVQSALAALGRARINLSNTVIRAPRSGQVSEASVRPGQYVSAGSQMLFLVPDVIWVVANFKETQVRHIRIGQPAWLTVDSLGDDRIHGRVEQLSPATGSEFSVLRPDNASGNFTKVVQRLPVRIRFDPDQPLVRGLRPGMSVVVHVNTAGEDRLRSGR